MNSFHIPVERIVVAANSIFSTPGALARMRHSNDEFTQSQKRLVNRYSRNQNAQRIRRFQLLKLAVN